MRPFWKCHVVSKILVKTSLKFHPIEVDLDLISTFGSKIEKNNQKLRFFFSYPGETDFDKKP